MSDAKIKQLEQLYWNGKAIKLADICRTAQRDGTATGYAVGLVCGEEKANGKVRYALQPLPELIKDRSAMEQATFNPYTARYTDEYKAACAVRKFAERFSVVIGDKAAKVLARVAVEPEAKAIKASACERVCRTIAGIKSEGERGQVALVALESLDDNALAVLDIARLEKFVEAVKAKRARADARRAAKAEKAIKASAKEFARQVRERKAAVKHAKATAKAEADYAHLKEAAKPVGDTPVHSLTRTRS